MTFKTFPARIPEPKSEVRSARFEQFREAWQRQLVAHQKILANALKVGIALCWYLNRKKGVAWPSVARLMRDTGLSRATIKRATKWLETQGYLRVLRTTKAHGEREVNRYRPTLRRAQVAAQDVGTEAVSEGGGLTTMSPRTSDDIPLNEPLNKTQSQKELGEEEREELRGNSASLSPDPKNLEAECYRLAHP